MVWMASVGIFDFDEFDVLHLGIFPSESDAPRRIAGVGVDGVFGRTLQFMVVKCWNEPEGFFIGLVEDGQPLEGFNEVEGSEFVDFLSAHFFAEKKLFSESIGEALNHREINTPKSE